MRMQLPPILIGLLASAAVQAQPMHESGHAGHAMAGQQPNAVTRAIAVLSPAAGGQVHGVITFEATAGGVKVVADVTGLSPGKHGFHIHEFGDCSTADYGSAGPHFMRPGESHGAPSGAMRHQGDLGNLDADAEGKAHAEWVDPALSLIGPGSILGRAVIVHEKEDDLKTQPTGNSGARIACGVIGIAQS